MIAAVAPTWVNIPVTVRVCHSERSDSGVKNLTRCFAALYSIQYDKSSIGARQQYILSEVSSQIGRTLFLLTQWVYTALNKQGSFYKNLTELRRHRWLRQQKVMAPVRTGSDMLSLKDIIQRLARCSSLTEYIRDFGTSSVVCLCACSFQLAQKTAPVNSV
ncbi:hypothetical protein [Coleofasciculus sp. G2-EDA-02]|jgi:hypothetical protein|uniref:hypothetical protein n=1 Tax=Coleofasciculus sp. G2-EDA-02 TaxID=3069529 RepID=UPI0032FF2CAA